MNLIRTNQYLIIGKTYCDLNYFTKNVKNVDTNFLSTRVVKEKEITKKSTTKV